MRYFFCKGLKSARTQHNVERRMMNISNTEGSQFTKTDADRHCVLLLFNVAHKQKEKIQSYEELARMQQVTT